MTDQEIIEKAFEVYPKLMDEDTCFVGDYICTKEVDLNKMPRKGYVKALHDVESLPKITGWVARDKDNGTYLHLVPTDRQPGDVFWSRRGPTIPLKYEFFQELTWESEPVEVEILIRKKQ